ncbi:hypothetical protein K435DRAFT_798918 [Dendrothele bispora CBS 962.96]|uniref:Uncharacterized protein n=1 Tax=Dendrothele bispora (strain CBS 962.96) TaxID=1314807 RepID=A0A4S8LYW4_DENBC|nr:hypothetical protein K435DRAFT_798918 [Dendrothele bispora CBS 962.96]
MLKSTHNPKYSPNATLFALWTIFSVIAHSTSVFALPTEPVRVVARDDTATQGGPKSAQQQLKEAFSFILATRGVQSAPGIAMLDVWTTVDSVGQNTAVSPIHANDILYNTLNVVKDRSGSPGDQENKLFFSELYTTWISDLSKALGINDEGKHDQVEKAEKAATAACGKQTDVLQILLQEWKDNGGGPIRGISDTKFRQWAEADVRYEDVSADCQEKTNKFHDALSEVYGDNFAVFSAARNNIDPIVTQKDVAYPGITMEVSEISGGSGSPGAPVAYYGIPVLNMTVSAWQNGEQLQGYDSSEDTATTSNSRLSLNFEWDFITGSVGGGGSNENSKNTTNATAESFVIKFGSVALMDIDMGLWNDLGASASAVHHASGDDPANKPNVKAVFDNHIGTQDKPGPAAIWNDKAIVVYQPEIQMKFSSEDAYEEAQHTSFSAGGCFLFICLGGSGEDTKNMASSSKTDKTITFNDTSKNAYIVGFVQTSFWAPSKLGESTGADGSDSSGGDNGGDGGDNGGDGGDNGGDGGEWRR